MTDSLWIFGYGSLIWNPDFPVAEKRLARLDGWQRGFCMRSIHHRGTEQAPGLVLALQEMSGEACDGVAFRVAPGDVAATLKQVRARELIASAYLERWLPVTWPSGGVTALCYVIDPDHWQYCGNLDAEEQAQIIAVAEGGRGSNRDYLWSTTAHLAELGISDPQLEWLAERVHQIAG